MSYASHGGAEQADFAYDFTPGEAVRAALGELAEEQAGGDYFPDQDERRSAQEAFARAHGWIDEQGRPTLAYAEQVVRAQVHNANMTGAHWIGCSRPLSDTEVRTLISRIGSANVAREAAMRGAAFGPVDQEQAVIAAQQKIMRGIG